MVKKILWLLIRMLGESPQGLLTGFEVGVKKSQTAKTSRLEGQIKVSSLFICIIRGILMLVWRGSVKNWVWWSVWKGDWAFAGFILGAVINDAQRTYYIRVDKFILWRYRTVYSPKGSVLGMLESLEVMAGRILAGWRGVICQPCGRREITKNIISGSMQLN